MIVTGKKLLFNSDEELYFTRPSGQNTDPREIGTRAAIRQIIAEGRRLSKTQQTQRTQRTKKLKYWKIVRMQITRIAF